MENLEEDAASTLSGSTVVNAGNSTAGDADEFPDPLQDDPFPPSFDLLGEFYDTEQRLDHELFGMRDDVRVYSEDFHNDPAFQGENTNWFLTEMRNITLWFLRLPATEYLTFVVRNRLQQLSHFDFIHRILNGMSHAVTSTRPTKANALLFGQVLATALLSDLDLIASMLKYRATALKLIVVGRILITMLVTSLPLIAARRIHGRSGGGSRGEGDIASMTQFWGGFLTAKALSLVLNQYDVLFERVTISRPT